MMDRRTTPANARVAALHLKGRVDAPRYAKGAARLLSVPIADLLNAPQGKRERQLLMGEAVTVYEDREGWSFVQTGKDVYVGYMKSALLAAGEAPTHWVRAAATHLYAAADIKSHERAGLSFGARLRVTGEVGRFYETPEGYVPRPHLVPLEKRFSDPVTVAALFMGTPYLWGGNSRSGIDCSGLVQAACLACGIACPADSDQQATALGKPLDADTALQRGDLLFWKGHVALVADEARILHANAHSMSVAYEGLEAAIARIEAAGDGPVTARRRLPKGKA